MKKFVSAATAALVIITAPAASAGVSAQNSSEAVAFSTEGFTSISERVQWMQENGMAAPGPLGWVATAVPMSFDGLAMSVFHWITAISGSIGAVLA